MNKVQRLPRGWRNVFSRLMQSAEDSICIASPYVTGEATTFLTQQLTTTFRRTGCLTLVTDLSPGNVVSGATDPAALMNLTGKVQKVVIRHLPSLHAKVYIADLSGAIVTSGNLTTSGLDRNYEYGILIEEPTFVKSIHKDISEYAELGAIIDANALSKYCHTAITVRSAFLRQQQNIAAEARKEFEHLLFNAETELISLRLSGASITHVFEKTVEYVLSKDGPLSTPEIHLRVQAIHPDLCDDSIDRVINGQHYGKRWKHAVRTAQAHLKEARRISLTNKLWHLL